MYSQDDLIEKKIDNTLTAQEAQQFDHLLAVDPAFAQAYATQRAMIEVFRQHQKEVLHQRLEAGYQTYQEKRTRWRYYYGAAALLLIVAGGMVAVWLSQSKANEQLFADYYQPYEVVMTRGSNSAQQAEMYYSQGQYARALPLLSSLQSTGNRLAYWGLLRGNAYLQLDSTTQALAQFEQVASSPGRYQQYGHWYAALSYLKKGDTAQARSALQAIAQQPGLFRYPAQQLLDKL